MTTFKSGTTYLDAFEMMSPNKSIALSELKICRQVHCSIKSDDYERKHTPKVERHNIIGFTYQSNLKTNNHNCVILKLGRLSKETIDK